MMSKINYILQMRFFNRNVIMNPCYDTTVKICSGNCILDLEHMCFKVFILVCLCKSIKACETDLK